MPISNISRFVMYFLIGVVATSNASDESVSSAPSIFNASYDEIPVKNSFNKEIMRIDRGDFAYPRFSPDGKYLAYSVVLVRDNVEGTKLNVLNLNTRSTKTILGADEADKHKVYKVYVFKLEWESNSNLAVYLSDGDVGLTKFVFDINTGEKLSTKFIDGDDDPYIPHPPFLKQQYDNFFRAFPKWEEDRDVIDTLFTYKTIAIGTDGIISQFRHSGKGENIWYFDFRNKREIKLLEIGQDRRFKFSGGVSVGEYVLFGVTVELNTFLFLKNESNELKLIGKYAVKNDDVSIIERVNSGGQSIFMLRHHRSYEMGHNPMFILSETGALSELSSCSVCYDFDVTKDGEIAAFAIWENGERILTIRKLK